VSMSRVTRGASVPLGLSAVLALMLSQGSGRARLTDIRWQPATIATEASFRGLSVARDGTIWVGGTDGTVLYSGDTGSTWTVDTVAGAHSFDFRGVAAIDASVAYGLVSSADTGRIYRTSDRGRTWQLLYRNEQHGVFLDGMGCWTDQRCLAAGDPVAGYFLIVTTEDGGAHWTQHDALAAPPARQGEAAFAASNTSVIVGSGGRAWIATGGGPTARVWRSSDYGVTWRVAETPVAAGNGSSGIFSLAFCDDQHGVAVGGNYRQPDSPGAHVGVSADGGGVWMVSDSARMTPYLSGVACGASAPGRAAYVAVGPSGTFAAMDASHWSRAARDGFNAIAVLAGQRLVAVGAKGAVATARLPNW
jgi:photosystem II stability/assembly factor-like uncharacterized protein